MKAKSGLVTAMVASLLAMLAMPALAGESVRWQPTLETAKQVAGQSNQLILIHFWAPYCTYCIKMEQEVLSQPAIASVIQANYVPVKLNTEYFPSVAKQYGVTKLPTDLIITPQGQLVRKFEGMPRAQDYLNQLTQIAAARPKTAPPVLAQLPTNPPPNPNPNLKNPSPAISSPAIPSPNPNLAYSNQAVTLPANQAIPSPAVHSPALSDPGYASISSDGPPTPRVVAPQPTANPVANPVVNPVANQVARPPVSQPISQPVQQPVASIAPVAFARPDTSPAKVASAGGITLPPGSPPLGLDGYCPVQLVEHHRWVLGDTRWGAIHQGRTYLFAGPEEQKRFLSEKPDAYAPVLSGMDVVLAVDQHQQVPGTRLYGGFFANHVYLFNSEATLKTFSQRPEYYTQALRTTADVSRPR